jgi:nucleotide-binding universal stress UspA family protein
MTSFLVIVRPYCDEHHYQGLWIRYRLHLKRLNRKYSLAKIIRRMLMFKHLLVPLDGSELSEKALPIACQGLSLEGTLTLLNAIELPSMNYISLYGMIAMVPRHDTDKLVPAIQKNAQVYLRRVVEKTHLPPTVKVNLEVCIGNPASVIVERAQALHVDAIVMSTHGRSGLNRWMFGSVTQRVLGLMPCPVIVVSDHGQPPFPEQPTASETVKTVS